MNTRYVSTMSELFSLINPKPEKDEEKAIRNLQFQMDEAGIVLVDHLSRHKALDAAGNVTDESELKVLNLNTSRVVPLLNGLGGIGEYAIVSESVANDLKTIMAETWEKNFPQQAAEWTRKVGKPRFFRSMTIMQSIEVSQKAEAKKDESRQAAEKRLYDLYYNTLGKCGPAAGDHTLDNRDWFTRRPIDEVLTRRLADPFQKQNAENAAKGFDEAWGAYKDFVSAHLMTLNAGLDKPIMGRELTDAIKQASRDYTGLKPFLPRTSCLKIDYIDNTKPAKASGKPHTRTRYCTYPSEDHDIVKKVVDDLRAEDVIAYYTFGSFADLTLEACYYMKLDADRQEAQAKDKAREANVGREALRAQLVPLIEAMKAPHGDRSEKSYRRKDKGSNRHDRYADRD